MRFLHLIPAAFLLFGSGTRADEPTAKPLPGNKPCPYPPEAQKRFVAGPVHFVVQVRPDGTAESVDVLKVPHPDLGFEDGVRTCVSQWRFDPAPEGSTGLRRHEGRLRFRIDAKEEAAIRGLLEALATAWNTGEKAALEGLSLQAADSPAIGPEPRRPIEEQLGSTTGKGRWRMELDAEVEHIRFLKPDLIAVRQPYRRQRIEKLSGVQPYAEAAVLDATSAMLDAMAVKGARGWRLLRIAPSETQWLGAVHIGGTIREPRKVKDVPPRYPDVAKHARVQGVVILECLITPEGKVANVRVLRGIPLLDEAAIEAVRQWEYTPTLLEGVPVRVIMTVTVNFRLS